MAPKSETSEPESAGMRVAKRLARAGVCSRREAEVLIAEGRVAVNGTVLETPAVVVQASDRVTLDGEPIPEPQAPRLWRFHKPEGVLTSNRDPQGRPTVFDLLPDHLPRVVTVGRLDLNSEGLLLLTNDGGLARHLELPSTGWRRRYRVRVYGPLDPKRLEALAQGHTVEGVRYGPILVKIETQARTNSWLQVTLTEGKNREIRRVMESLGLQVNRLTRIGYGPFALGQMPRKGVEEVPFKVLKEQLGQQVLDAL